MPWDRKPSILEFVRAHIPVGKPRLSNEGDKLPDEELVAQSGKIRWALGALDGVMTHHMGKGENNEAREKLRMMCNAILCRSEWVKQVQAKLSSEDELEFAHADRAAKALCIDTCDIHWQRLREKPTDPGRWYHVMVRCDENRIGRVTEFAEASLDLSAIATGAGDVLGLDSEFEQHSCLDFILQELRRFPGQGTKLIDAGLKNPVIRNRNMAVAALAGWPRADWFECLEKSLKEALIANPMKACASGCRKL